MTEDQLKSIVRANIRRYRGFRKWTQADLAEKLDISVNFLSDVENGKKWISLTNIVKFANVLNIEPFELFKPANAPAPDVSVLLTKYNDQVKEALSVSIENIYNYFQSGIDKNNMTEKNE